MAFIKSEQNEDQQPFLPEVHDDTRLSETDSRKVPTGWKGYLRWGLEVVMALAIVVLLIRPVSERKTGKSSPVPQCTFSMRPISNNNLRATVITNVKLQSLTENLHLPRESKVLTRRYVQ